MNWRRGCRVRKIAARGNETLAPKLFRLALGAPAYGATNAFLGDLIDPTSTMQDEGGEPCRPDARRNRANRRLILTSWNDRIMRTSTSSELILRRFGGGLGDCDPSVQALNVVACLHKRGWAGGRAAQLSSWLLSPLGRLVSEAKWQNFIADGGHRCAGSRSARFEETRELAELDK
jgi:hypothetical protein